MSDIDETCLRCDLFGPSLDCRPGHFDGSTAHAAQQVVVMTIGFATTVEGFAVS